MASTIPRTRGASTTIFITVLIVAAAFIAIWFGAHKPHPPVPAPITAGPDTKPNPPTTNPTRVTYYITATIDQPKYRRAAVTVRLTVGTKTIPMPLNSGFYTTITARPEEPVHISLTQVETGYLGCRIQRNNRTGPVIDHQDTTPTDNQPGTITCTTLKAT